LNRCDFSSISTCLKNHISESNQMSQPDFLYELFEDFMGDPTNQDFSMDNGLVCRWMTGQAKISPKISAYYSKPYCTLPLKEIEDTNALLQLASAFYSEADTYRTTVEKTIETVHSHTFAVELAAKLLENAFPYMDNYNYHKGMNGIIQELTGLLKTKNIGTIYLMTANLPQAKTHFKRAFKIYEKIWADEPEMIEAKYQEIQELYPQIGFSIGKNLSGLLTK
jgi:tetratricopeptide (TPR) repeat protein